MNTSVVTIDPLTRRFKETTAVNQMRVKVHVGEIFGFPGHGRAGKNSPACLLNGVIEPASDNTRVFGALVRSGGEGFTPPTTQSRSTPAPPCCPHPNPNNPPCTIGVMYAHCSSVRYIPSTWFVCIRYSLACSSDQKKIVFLQ